MRERVRRERAGTKLVRGRVGRAEMKERVECKGLLLRITAGEAHRRRAVLLPQALLLVLRREGRERVAAARLAARS